MASSGALLLLGLERRHNRAVVGADAPIGMSQRVSLVGDPFARQTGADQDVINARITIGFAVVMRPGDVARFQDVRFPRQARA